MHVTRRACLLFVAGLSMVACHRAPLQQARPLGVILEVPFQRVRNQVFITVHLNGKGPFTFSLDTGTDPSVVDLATARAIGLQIDTIRHTGEGVGDHAIVGLRADLRSLDVGTGETSDVVAVAVDLSAPAARLGVPLHGVLGYSFLARKALQIDYVRQRVRFFQTGSPIDEPPPPGFRRVVVPLGTTPGQSMPVLRFWLHGVTGWLLVDTGSNLDVTLVPGAVQLFGLATDSARARADSVVGYGGRSFIRQAWIHGVDIGGIVLDSVEATFRDRGLGADAAERSGTVGNGVLSRYVLSLDYRRGLMALDAPTALPNRH